MNEVKLIAHGAIAIKCARILMSAADEFSELHAALVLSSHCIQLESSLAAIAFRPKIMRPGGRTLLIKLERKLLLKSHHDLNLHNFPQMLRCFASERAAYAVKSHTELLQGPKCFYRVKGVGAKINKL